MLGRCLAHRFVGCQTLKRFIPVEVVVGLLCMVVDVCLVLRPSCLLIYLYEAWAACGFWFLWFGNKAEPNAPRSGAAILDRS